MEYPWSSARTLVPLIVGVVGLVVFLAYEAYLAKEPTVPIHLLQNRTSLSGYVCIWSTVSNSKLTATHRL